MINDMSGGKVTSQIIDDNHVPVLSQQGIHYTQILMLTSSLITD